MNKVRIILIGVCILFTSQVFGYDSVNTKDHNFVICPEPDVTDWVFINAFLTDPEHEDIRETLGVKKYKFEKDELESFSFEAVKKYLNNKGIKFVSNHTLCDKLTRATDQSDIEEQYKNNFTKRYFQFNNRYLVFYKPNESNLLHRTWLVQIVDNSFSVIGDYYLR